jgi:alkaline phosphatase D
VRKDSVDYVLHLGDYLYEYKVRLRLIMLRINLLIVMKNGYYGWGNSVGRIPLPDHEIYT